MRLEMRVRAMAAVAALCLAPVAAEGQRPVVEGMSQRLTVACGSGGAHVQGTGNTVTLTGACTSVLVEGSNNTVHIATLGSLKVGGMSNKVYWTEGIDGATPKVTKEGMGNTVERKTPADSPSAGTASTAPKPATGGTASATASTPSSGATATAAPGAPSLVVSKGDKTVAAGASAGGSASVKAKRGEPAAARPTASSMGTGTPIVVANNQQVRTMECEGRAVSVSGNGNRLTLKGACGPISGRRQREHPRRRLDAADRHLRQPECREVPRAGQRQGPDGHVGRQRQPRVQGGAAAVDPPQACWRRDVPPTDGPGQPRGVLSLPGCAPVAQLDRASGFEPGGREFESLRAHQFGNHPPVSARSSAG